MNNIYVSSNAFTVRTLDAIFRECDALGIERVEVGSGVAYDKDARKKIVKRSKKTKILLHNYIPAPPEPFVLNLASAEQDIVEKSMALATEALSISAEIGAPVYGVHSGFAYTAEPALLGGKQSHLPHVPLPEAAKIFIENIHRLSEVAQEAGVKLLVENNSLPAFNLIDGKNKSYLMAGIDDSLEAMKLFSSWGVGLLVDTGHVKVTALALGFDPIDYVERLRDYIGAFHINDNDGATDQARPASADSWFLGTVRSFPETMYLTLETDGHLTETLESVKLFST